MTQEEKDLLFRDLCARLPYGVKIVIQDTFRYSTVPREYHVLDASNFSDIFCFNYKKFSKRMKKAIRERPNDIVIKPYLRSMSSMTDEERVERIALLWELEGHINEDVTYKYQDWLNAHHLDYRGLIPKGLAIDCTNLNIY